MAPWYARGPGCPTTVVGSTDYRSRRTWGVPGPPRSCRLFTSEGLRQVLLGRVAQFLTDDRRAVGQRSELARRDHSRQVDQTAVGGQTEPLGGDELEFGLFKGFLDNFNNGDVLGGTRISEQAWQNSFIVAVGASPYAAHAVVDTWLTDFRADLPKIDVPTLAIHGDADRILPLEATAARLPGLIKDVELVTVEGGPHNIAWTHPDEVNSALLAFLTK
jgi:pimeloyl-ACP methyl ester carboxylesterase